MASALSCVAQTQRELNQLDATARALVEELAASGAQATPRLKELVAAGERLVASVGKNCTALGSALPAAGKPLPAAPDPAAVDAVWARLQEQEQGPVLLPTPVAQPAASLQQLASTLAGGLPTCRLQLLEGSQPAAAAERATVVLLHCGRAFTAVVHLQPPGSLQPLRVGVLSAAEAAAALCGGGGSSGSSLWAPSQHAVHRHLAAQAAAALQHFGAQPQRGSGSSASTLELLLLWLAGDAFCPAATDGALLLADPAAAGGGLLPPLRRRTDLSWHELWQAALNPELRRAAHVQE